MKLLLDQNLSPRLREALRDIYPLGPSRELFDQGN